MEANFKLSLVLLLFITFSLLLLHLVSGEVRPKAYITPDQCRHSEFFDVLSLSCVSCATIAELNFSIEPPNQSEVLESTAADKTTCVCRRGLLLDQRDGKYRCVNHSSTCPAGQVFLHGECGQCEEPDCQCHSDFLRKVYLIEEATNTTTVHFRCEPFQATMDLAKGPCHSSYLLASGEPCKCPRDNYVEEDGQCLAQRALLSADTRLQYATIRFRSARFMSQHLYTTLRPAVYNCNNLKNQTACQHLLNLCVQKLVIELSSLESGEEKWNLCLYLQHHNPLLDFQVDAYYASDHQESAIQDQFHATDTVQLVATTFGSDGHFQRMAALRLNDLFLCSSAKLKHDSISFGTALYKRCTWQATELWEMAMQAKNKQFMELYLVSGTSKLYPVPVRVSFGQQIATRWMVKRFFLLNSQIGVDLVRFGQQGTAQFVLYARSVTLQFTISPHSVNGQIFPPVLLVEYEAIDASVNRPNHSIETEFSVVFQMNDSQVKYNLSLAISILSSFAVLWSIFRTWCWMKRSASALDLSVVGTFVAIAISTVSNILLLVSLFYTVNQLVVFKFQTVIHTVLFTPEQEGIIIVYLVIAYIFKLIQLLSQMISITSVDLFFIDWEKPRKKEMLESNGKMEYKDRERISSSGKRPEKMEQANNHRKASGVSSLGGVDPSANVTIWRSYFIANEWCELNAKRRIDISLHIFVLVLLLECTDLKYFTRAMSNADPTSGQWLEEVPERSTARIALAAVFYILLASLQYLYRKYIAENLGWGKLNEFIDLCSVSNISVFCLKYKRFGYYLHGLSPNGRSDVNMLEMYNLLEMEESDLCSKRGLLPNTEQQTFEMLLPSVVHDHWKGLRKPFDRSSPTAFLPKMNVDLRSADKAKLVHTYYAINRFLCSFIEHSSPKADYIVQDRSSLESLLNFELDSAQQKGRLYNDNGHSFEEVLLYGIEPTLSTFELLTFLILDLMWHNFLIAAIGTYFISKVLTRAYAKMSRKNLVHKTLMDERFLI